jgi:hypothetical protein
MKVGTATHTRKTGEVHPITIELEANLYKGLLRYCESFGRSKRHIIEDALNCWIADRDMEAAKREADAKDGK